MSFHFCEKKWKFKKLQKRSKRKRFGNRFGKHYLLIKIRVENKRNSVNFWVISCPSPNLPSGAKSNIRCGGAQIPCHMKEKWWIVVFGAKVGTTWSGSWIRWTVCQVQCRSSLSSEFASVSKRDQWLQKWTDCNLLVFEIARHGRTEVCRPNRLAFGYTL